MLNEKFINSNCKESIYRIIAFGLAIVVAVTNQSDNVVSTLYGIILTYFFIKIAVGNTLNS